MKTFAAVSIILANFGLVIACSCVKMDEAQQTEALKNYAVIFQGEVISVGEDTVHCMKDERGKCLETAEGGKIVERASKDFTFKVEKYWKGIESETITIQTRLDSCRWTFEKGEKIVLAAKENRYEESKKPFLVDNCDWHLAKPELVKKVFGEGKTFAEKRKSEVNSTNLLTTVWQTIVSFFS